MQVFLSRQPAVKTKEAKKVSRLAKRVNSVVRKNREPGVCVVTVYKKD